MSIVRAFRDWITARDIAESEFEDDSSMFDRGQTKVVIGLGNPGRKYAGTRHNMGFMVIDELARRHHAPTSRQRMKSEITEARIGDDRVVLAMPQTYMNESGLALREISRWYKTPPEDILIVVDDLDQPFGQIRLRPKGGAGGHNGLKSIFQQMGTEQIPRLRVGIGRGRGGQVIAHVLSRFSEEEQAELPTVIDQAADSVELWLAQGIIEAMNLVNANTPV
ncbi:MAG TPA: aminoacyl-tRNA hydrolase [Thermomicrobiales bacterium]|nr:aminoacyl-tRNA hydrolase [Thermomicrobiales bacterium]